MYCFASITISQLYDHTLSSPRNCRLGCIQNAIRLVGQMTDAAALAVSFSIRCNTNTANLQLRTAETSHCEHVQSTHNLER